MYIKKDMDFNDLMNNCWSGAIDTLKTIEDHDKEDELIQHLEELYLDDIPTLTEINDYLWFEDSFIFECLGIAESEESEEEEEISYKDYDDFEDFCSDSTCDINCLFYTMSGNCEKNFYEIKEREK